MGRNGRVFSHVFLGRVEAGADAGRDKADVCPPKRRDEMDARFEACIFYAPAAGRPAGTAEKRAGTGRMRREAAHPGICNGCSFQLENVL